MSDERAYPPVSPLLVGVMCRCPRCGKGKLFDGFLSLPPRCNVCGLDYSFIDAGDGPAVFIMFFAGFVVVGEGTHLLVIRGQQRRYLTRSPRNLTHPSSLLPAHQGAHESAPVPSR